ncbi:MAG: 50S ribosomal protein L17 [Clostridiales bacterium]|nr:50S ribosomal protein L17 [Clostridiales bacterium]
MPVNRKLGRVANQRRAMLRGLVTAFFESGRIETTLARAKEIQSIVENLITLAAKEANNYTTKEIKVSKAKVDAKGKKVTKVVKSKNGREYSVVEREFATKEVKVDAPSRLQARRMVTSWLYRTKDKDGNYIHLANKIFDEIAPKYSERKGGYTRIYKLGPRRGDGAEVAILELV